MRFKFLLLLAVCCLLPSQTVLLGAVEGGAESAVVFPPDDVSAAGFKVSAREAFEKRIFKAKLRRMARRNSALSDDQRAVVKKILSDTEKLDAAFYGWKAEVVESLEDEGDDDDGGSRFPILEKIIDAILNNPDGFIEFLQKIIDLFSGLISLENGASGFVLHSPSGGLIVFVLAA